MNSAGTRMMTAVVLGGALAGCATATPPPTPHLVWPLPPESPRIHYVESFSGADHFAPKGRNWIKDAVVGPDPAERERLAKPFAVTTDPQGRVYVTDTGASRVWIFDGVKREVRFLGESGQGALVTPSGVAVDARGTVFVADTRRDRVFAYDDKGTVIMEIGKPDEFYSPGGLAIDRRSNRLYVADAGRHKVRVYDTRTGQFLFEFGKRGLEPGDFNYPTHLFLRGDRLSVADTMNFRIQQFTLDGQFVGKFGEMGAQLGQFARPKGVAVDSDGHIYVVDAAFGNVQIFEDSAEHPLLLFVGQVGSEPGQFMLPAGMFIDEEDRIYVADGYNRRVQVFEYLKHGEVVRAGNTAAESAASTSTDSRKGNKP